MTAELVNLRCARKSKLRAQGDKQAQENRVKFGRSKHEKTVADLEKIRSAKILDAHEREP